MTTREIIEGLPANVRERVEAFRAEYVRLRAAWNAGEDRWHEMQTFRAKWYGYTLGLVDAGIISDRQRPVVYIYGTV